MTSPKRIPTNLRTLLILEAVANASAPLTATEINAKIGLPKQTVHRLCTTLEEEGFLTREPGGRRFRPSRRLRSMGTGLLTSSRGHIARHQVLQDIAASVRETVNYVVPVETGMSYLDRVETDWPFRIQLPIGSSVPFHCTASGKCFLASLPPPTRKRFVGALTLSKLTPRTHTTPASLLEELTRVADQGYAIDNEEFMDGMVAIAVPVVDPKGRYTASLAFHGPEQRMSVPDMIDKRGVLFAGAEKLGDVMFDDAEDEAGEE